MSNEKFASVSPIRAAEFTPFGNRSAAMGIVDETISTQDVVSEGPPAIAADPSFHDILAGYKALADEGKLQTVSPEHTHQDWLKTKKQIRELRQELASKTRPE